MLVSRLFSVYCHEYAPMSAICELIARLAYFITRHTIHTARQQATVANRRNTKWNCVRATLNTSNMYSSVGELHILSSDIIQWMSCTYLTCFKFNIKHQKEGKKSWCVCMCAHFLSLQYMHAYVWDAAEREGTNVQEVGWFGEFEEARKWFPFLCLSPIYDSFL